MKINQTRTNLATLLLAACLAVGSFNSAVAVPANPKPLDVTQPDGTKLKLRLRGDEFFHWQETVDGYAVAKDSADGYWKLARPAAGQAEFRAIPGARADSANPVAYGLTKHALPDPAVLRAHVQARRRALLSSALELPAPQTDSSGKAGTKSGGTPSPNISVAGTKTIRNIVILACFSNHWDYVNNTVLPSYGRVDTNEYYNLYNQVGYTTDGAVGSVKDYYREISYGKLTIDSIITMWVRLPRESSYYGAGQHTGIPATMVADAIEAAAAAGFDFSQGDSDGDGWVDVLDVLHSGYGEESTGNPDDVWSVKGSISSVVTKNGVKMYNYHEEPALRGSSGTGIERIGTICHESGHFFGLPDLYDYSPLTDGLGNWCLMAGGPWNGDSGSSPAHPSAWAKAFLGFAKTVPVHSKTGLSLPRVEDNAVVGMLRDGTTNQEYFLIENRAKIGFDNSTQINPGLLIYHVDQKNANNDMGTWPHPAVKIEEADGNDSLGMTGGGTQAGDAWTSTSGLAGGWRDQTGNTNTTAMLYQPNPAPYQTNLLYSRTDNPAYYTYNTLNNFSAAGSSMTFNVQSLKTDAPTQNALPAPFTVFWAPSSQATKYEIQEGSPITLTSFTDGAESVDAMYDNWYVAGKTLCVTTNASHGGTNCYFLLQPNYGAVQSLVLRKPFKVTASTVVSFYLASRISAGNGFLKCEISNDGGDTWKTLSTDSGNIAPWAARSFNYTNINAAGISNGDLCLLRFLVDIEYPASYAGFPGTGFALDDISITGTEIAGYGGWTTLDNNVTTNSYSISGKTAGVYAYRVQPYANGAWQGYGSEGEITVRANQAPTWTVNPITGTEANVGAAYNADLSTLTTDEMNDVVAFSKVSGPAWLTINANGAIAGTPAASDAGANTFTVRATDLAGAYSDATLTLYVRSPLSDWRMNELTGPTVYDSIGGFNGTAQGPLVYGQPGVPGAAAGNSAITFSGSGTAVTVPALNVASNTVTITALIKRNGTQPYLSGIVSPPEFVFGFGNLNNQLTYVRGGYVYGTSALVVPDNQWTFVALVISPDNAVLYMATNAAVFSYSTSRADPAATIFTNTTSFGNSPWGRFNGTMDDVAIYGTALSASQIGQLAATAFTPVPLVTVTSPADGAGFIKPATFGLSATVVPNGHSIGKMQFYNATTLLAEVTTPPYTTGVTNLDLGTYTFSAKAVYDGGDVVGSAPITVHVTNAPPVVVADTASTTQNTPVTIPVLANDSDPYNLPLSIQSITQPARGAATIAGTNVVYTPNNYWYGVDTFTYTVNDGTGSTATTNVTVTTAYPNFASECTNAILADAPVAYWRLNETSGTTAYDSTVNAKNGTNSANVVLGTNGVGAPTFPGFESGNKAYQFNGAGSSSGRVSVPALNLNSGALTITAWVKRNGTQYYTGVVSWNSGGTVIDLGFGNNDNRLTYVRNGSVYNSSSLVMPDNQWTFVALALTSSNAVLYMATNSTLASYTITRTDSAFTVFTNTAYIGYAPYGDGYFRGGIDEVAVFNQLLTPAQIGDLLLTSQTALPTVALTAPTNSASFDAPPSVPLSAAVTTNGNHTLDKVQFYTNATLLAEVLAPPYTYNWSGMGVGTYSVTARALYDGAGAVTSTIANITITDTNPPTIVSVPAGGSASANGSCLAAVPDVATSTVATDNFSTVTITQSPLAGTMVGLGGHTITITATDVAGNTNSATTTFTVNDTTPPAITSVPAGGSATANGSGFAPVPDVASGTVASDNCSGVVNTQSPVAGTMVGVEPHTITVTATDEAGNTNTATTTFTVNSGNRPPVPGAKTLGAIANLPATLNTAKLVAVATDPDGDPMSVTAVSATSTNGGQVSLAGTTITYLSATNYAGPDSFTYTLSDNHGGTATGTVIVAVASGQSYNQIGIAVLGNGDVELRYAGIPGSSYALDWTHDLTAPIGWSPLQTNTAANTGLVLFTNTPSSGSDFYRTRFVSGP